MPKVPSSTAVAVLTSSAIASHLRARSGVPGAAACALPGMPRTEAALARSDSSRTWVESSGRAHHRAT